MSMPVSYPYDGELFPASTKRFQETVFFVHFFGGNKKKLKRHIQFVNALGFDAFAFNLYVTPSFPKFEIPISSSGKLGLKHIYADQVEELLNQIDGKKIVYSFSNPSASAIEAMARRFCTDTTALICDSGPSVLFTESFENLFNEEIEKKPWLKNSFLAWPLKKIKAKAFVPFWSPALNQDVHEDLEKFPKKFPVLSIRGWKDKLVPPHHIDAVFEPHHSLQWRKLSLPEAGHLNGLKDFADEYSPTVRAFLEGHATLLPIS